MKFSQHALVAVMGAGLFAATGCKPSSTTPVADPGAAAEHGHDHGDGEHDHDHAGEAHGHGAGPHDGTLADWGGGKYHVEFTVDHDQQQATVYVLAGDEKTPVPIPATEIQLTIADPATEVTLAADPQPSDPDGMASRFVGQHENLATVQEYSGTITGVIEDTPYTAEFAEGEHTHP